MNRFLSAFLVMLLLSSASASAAAPARPADDPGPSSFSSSGKKVKVVAKSAFYGFGGGLVVGLASQVFKSQAKNIFLFGSLGLYAGIAVGIYAISTANGPQPYEGPDTYDDFSWNHSTQPLELARNEKRARKQETKVNLVEVPF